MTITSSGNQPASAVARRSAGHRITGWNPEDTAAWDAGNKAVARRNLIWSTAIAHITYSIWSLWSVMVLFMPESVYGITTADKLLLTATATLIGGAVRIPYVAGTTRFGGRNWAVLSTLVLVIPTAGTIALLADPGRPLWMYLVCAALTGLGGGNCASALADVERFYPQRLKGLALGLTGGIGNLGVAGIQLVGLLVLAAAGGRRPYWVCAIYLLLLAIASVGAALRMDNLSHGGQQAGSVRAILAVPDTWTISVLYCATFGSFIGFAFVFVQVLQITFLDAGQGHAQAALHAAAIAFVGPLLGAVSRIYGGRLADRYGGGSVTLAVFSGMILTTGVLAATSMHDDRIPGSMSTADTVAYIVAFIVLFILAGMGNGSVMKMIPSVFEVRSRAIDCPDAERRSWAGARTSALIGLATSIGALGGAAINLILRQAYASSGTETPAFVAFLVGYVVAALLTYLTYIRPSGHRTYR